MEGIPEDYLDDDERDQKRRKENESSSSAAVAALSMLPLGVGGMLPLGMPMSTMPFPMMARGDCVFFAGLIRKKSI